MYKWRLAFFVSVALVINGWVFWAAVQTVALTNTGATITWTPTTDATIRYELRWKGAVTNGLWVIIATNIDSTAGKYAQVYPAVPDTLTDRTACWDARAVKGTLASPWLSESGKQVCLTIPVAVVPIPPPPPPSGLQVTSATPLQVVIVASSHDCTRLVTSTKGSTSTVFKRTVVCQK